MGAARALQLSGRFMSVVMGGFYWRILPQHELNRLMLLKARTARKNLSNRASNGHALGCSPLTEPTINKYPHLGLYP
jgi:hypothetical protein